VDQPVGAPLEHLEQAVGSGIGEERHGRAGAVGANGCPPGRHANDIAVTPPVAPGQPLLTGSGGTVSRERPCRGVPCTESPAVADGI
jgi:hypothetical protein